MSASFDRKSLVSAAVGGAAAACVVVAYLWQRDATEEKRAAAASRDMPQRFGAMDVGDARATSSRARSASQPEGEGPVTFPLSRSLYKRLEHDGYLVLRGMLPKETVAAARGVCEKIVDGLAAKLLAEGKIADLMEGEPFERRLAKLYEAHPEEAPTIFREELHAEGAKCLFFNGTLLDTVERILNTSEVRLYPNYALYPKMPQGAASATPAAAADDADPSRQRWHAGRMVPSHAHTGDEVREAVNGMINAWTPLVSTTKANGCIRVIPRSHMLDVVALQPARTQNVYQKAREEGYLEANGGAVTRFIRDGNFEVVDLELEPGDVLLFKQRLVHSGRPNRTDTVRWSFDWRYQDAALPTLREEQGHIARSEAQPHAVVRDGRHWATLPMDDGASKLKYTRTPRVADGAVAASRRRSQAQTRDAVALQLSGSSSPSHARGAGGGGGGGGASPLSVCTTSGSPRRGGWSAAVQPAATMMDMDDVAMSRLNTEGYAVIRGMLPQETVAAARGVCEKIVDGLAAKLLAEGKIADLMEGEPFERRLAKLYEAHPEEAPTIFHEELHTAALSKVFLLPRLLDLVERMLDTPELRLFPNYSLHPKMRGNGREAAGGAAGGAAWHAGRMRFDPGSFSEDTVRGAMEGMINVWMPLVPTDTDNGCMRVVPGSHRLDVLSLLPKQGTRAFTVGFLEAKRRGYIEIDEALMAEAAKEAVDIRLAPGDVLLFKQNLIHSGRPNTTDGVRWSMDWRYQDATLPTLREEQGDIVRSEEQPSAVLRDGEHFESLPLDNSASALGFQPAPQSARTADFLAHPPHVRRFSGKRPSLHASGQPSVDPRPQYKAALERDGFVVVRGLLPRDALAGAQGAVQGLVDEMAALLKQQGKVRSVLADEPVFGEATRLVSLFERSPADVPHAFAGAQLHRAPMGALFFCSQLLDVVQSLLGTPEVRLFPDFAVFPKVPASLWSRSSSSSSSSSKPSPSPPSPPSPPPSSSAPSGSAATTTTASKPAAGAWHSGRAFQSPQYTQDEVRDAVAGMLNVWVPLTSCTKSSGCVRVIPGSHRLDVLSMCPKQGKHPLGRARGGEGYLEIPPESLAEHVDSAVDVLLEPGDVLFFKPGTIHSGHPNVGEGVRWSVEFKFQDAEKLTLRDGAEGDIARSLKQPRGVVLDGAQWASLPLHRGARALGYAVPRQPKLSGSSGALAVLNAQDVALARLNTEGYAVIRGMLPQETVAAARGVCEKIVDGLAAKLLAEGKIADLMEGEPFERRLAKLYEAHPEEAPTIFRQELRTQAMSHLFFNAPLLDLVERILDTPELRLAGDFAAYPKRPRSALPAAQQQLLYAGGKSLWHAARMNYDQLNVSEELMEASLEGTINVWTPLVSTTKANGCVRVVPGSHRLDVLCMLPRQDAHSHPSKGRGYLEVDEQLMAAHENKAVDVELEPGDIFLFKQNLIHSGRPNTTDGVRWSMDWRYQDARRQNLNLNPELSSLARSASNPQSAGWSKLD